MVIFQRDGVDCILKASGIEADIQVNVEGGTGSDSAVGERHRPAVVVRDLLIPTEGITAIIGKSGSGKSSLLAMLSGLRSAKSSPGAHSELLFRGRSGEPRDLLRGDAPLPGDIGFVFQEAHLLKSVSAKRNAALAAVIAPVTPEDDVFKVWAGALDLKKVGAEPLETYSGGQQQRVAVMRALSMDPALLVCDEPTSSLDDTTASTVMREIFKWASRPGRAVLWVTHSRDFAARYASWIVGVHDGQVLVQPNGQPFRQKPARNEAERLANLADIERIVPSKKAPAELAPEVGAEPTYPAEVRGWSRRKAWWRAIGSAYASSMAIAFADYWRTRTKRTGRLSGTVATLDTLWRLALKSLTLVFLLGLAVFYGVYTASTAFDRHFERRLAAPETAHFILTARSVDLLTVPRVPVLDKAMGLPDASSAPGSRPPLWRRLPQALLETMSPASPLRQPRHYGRRHTNMSQIWRAEGTRCEHPQSGGHGLGMLVFNIKEPLFANLEVAPRNGGGRRALETLSARELVGGAIVTHAVYSVGVSGAEEAQLEGFALHWTSARPPMCTSSASSARFPVVGPQVTEPCVDEGRI